MKTRNRYRKNPPQCPVMVGFKSTGETELVRCKQWSCPYCQKRIARAWAIRTFRHIEALAERFVYNGKRVAATFITFTLPGNVRNADDGYKMLPKLWNTFRMRMRRAYGARWQYLAFVEGQQKTRGGMPHFHIISTCPLPIQPNVRGYTAKRKIHAFALAIGFGYMADQKPMSGRGAAYYVSKYATKQDLLVPCGTRRVRACRDWYKFPKADRKPLLVMAHGESYTSFILRVADVTGIEPDVLSERWIAAKPQLSHEQTIVDSMRKSN